MPRGIDRSGDPNNDMSREGFFGRIMSRITGSGPAAPMAAPWVAPSGRTPPPPPGPRTPAEKAARMAQAGRDSELRRRSFVEPTQVFSLRQNTAPGRADARVEQSRELGARLSGHISAGRHLGDNPDKSLSYWRSNDQGYRKP